MTKNDPSPTYSLLAEQASLAMFVLGPPGPCNKRNFHDHFPVTRPTCHRGSVSSSYGPATPSDQQGLIFHYLLLHYHGVGLGSIGTVDL